MPIDTEELYKPNPVYQKLSEASKQYGIPSWIVSSIVEHESKFNPNAHGDIGLGESGSWGLFQLYTGNGHGKGRSSSELTNIDTNIAIAMPHLKRGYEIAQSKGLTGFSLLKETASRSGWPLMTGNMPSSYEKGLRKTFENGDELSGLKGNQIINYELKYKQADPTVWLTGKTQKVDSTLLGRVALLSKDYGVKTNITSGWRSSAEQQILWDRSDKSGRMVARPGRSKHEKTPAQAVDVSGKLTTLNNAQLKPYGLRKPMSYENWHIEILEGSEEVSNGGGFNTVEIKENIRNGFDMMNIDELSQGSYSLFRAIDKLGETRGELNGTLSDGFGIHSFVNGSGKAIGFRFVLVFIGIILILGAIFRSRGY
jgi:hypothetical protein